MEVVVNLQSKIKTPERIPVSAAADHISMDNNNNNNLSVVNNNDIMNDIINEEAQQVENNEQNNDNQVIPIFADDIEGNHDFQGQELVDSELGSTSEASTSIFYISSSTSSNPLL